MATIYVSGAEDVNLPPAEEIAPLLKEKLYPFEATFVMDGDTVRGNAHLGLGVSISSSIRLLGLNAPDLNEITGQQARAKVQASLFD